MFNNIHDAIHWIEVQVKFKPKTDLIRMRTAYQMLGIDLDHVKKIHVAGTNGKGSVSSYLSHILIEAGYRVGTFTSPYLVRFNERVRFQMKEIPDADLLKYINKVYLFNIEFEKVYGENLSFFELLTLISLLYFEEIKCDILVMEVGLGGLLDATNVLNYDLSLIVSIGMDHMKQLGNTLESIAWNKLGILKPGNHLITTVSPALHDYFKEYVKKVPATMDIVNPKEIELISNFPLSYKIDSHTIELSLLGSYQIDNSLLSYRAIRYLFPDISIETILKGLKKTTWNGRLEEIDHHVYIDGAHNTHAIDALIETSKTTFKDQPVWILFSALGDKDIPGMLKQIASFASKVVVTTFPDPRFVDLKDIAHDFEYIENPFNAIWKLRRHMTENTILIITGSLHFIGYIKTNYKKTCD
jgi:dihydrofolate synthase / folylpolyglutamate synthase